MHKTYIISLLIACVILSLGGISVYQYNLLCTERQTENELIKEAQNNSVLTANNQEPIVKRDTEYIMEKYDAASLKLTEEKLTVPVEMFGLSREELIDYVNKYQESPTLDDIGKGFLSAEVISFSKDKIIIRKNYEGSLEEDALTTDCFILVAENDYASVYRNDYSHLYMTTDIPLERLSSELKQEIMDGKIFYSTEELYHFLEDYTS